jgi:hypothetical protein
MWNAGKTRIAALQNHIPPDVIITERTEPKTVIIPENRNICEVMVEAEIAAIRDSIPPMFITKITAFQPVRLTQSPIHYNHDHVILTAGDTFITEVVFVDCWRWSNYPVS